EHIAGDERGDPERKHGGRRGGFVSETAPRILHVGEDAVGVAVELMALVGDGEAAPVALEEGDAEVGLELLDRFGDGRLADRKALRGARNGALLGDGDEVLQLAQGEGHGADNALAAGIWKPRRA